MTTPRGDLPPEAARARVAQDFFSHVALCFVIWRIFWPGDATPISTLGKAAFFALVSVLVQQHRQFERKTPLLPYPARAYWMSGVAGLGACTLYWTGTAASLSWGELVTLAACAAYSLFLFPEGISRARQRWPSVADPA